MADGVSVTGIYNSGQFTKDLAKPSFQNTITRLMPNGTAPIYTISDRLKSETAVNVEHGFYTKSRLFPMLTLAANITAAETTLTVESTANLVPGQVHRFEATGENILINQVISPTSVSVVRNIGGGAAAIAVATQNPKAYQVGSAFEEASLRPNALAGTPVRITNLTQIFRDTWAISGSAEQVKVIAGDTTVSENRRDCMMLHAQSIEAATIFGKKAETIRNGQPFRAMDGLLSIIGNLSYYPPSYSQPNVYVAQTAGTSLAQLEDMLDPVFNQTTDPAVGNARVLFAGGNAVRVINKLAMMNGYYKLVDGQTNWGLRFKTLTLARGTFDIVEHPLFNSNSDWIKMLLALDPTCMGYAYLGNRRHLVKDFYGNGQGTAVDQGIDAMGGTLTTELTMLVRNPPANAVITNMTAAIPNA